MKILFFLILSINCLADTGFAYGNQNINDTEYAIHDFGFDKKIKNSKTIELKFNRPDQFYTYFKNWKKSKSSDLLITEILNSRVTILVTDSLDRNIEGMMITLDQLDKNLADKIIKKTQLKENSFLLLNNPVKYHVLTHEFQHYKDSKYDLENKLIVQIKNAINSQVIDIQNEMDLDFVNFLSLTIFEQRGYAVAADQILFNTKSQDMAIDSILGFLTSYKSKIDPVLKNIESTHIDIYKKIIDIIKKYQFNSNLSYLDLTKPL